LIYAGGGVVVVLLACWLVGRWRSRKIRPSLLERESALDIALRRFERGEIGERELHAAEQRALGSERQAA